MVTVKNCGKVIKTTKWQLQLNINKYKWASQMLGTTNKIKETRQIINGKGTKKSRKDFCNCRDEWSSVCRRVDEEDHR